jgi:hypothetical protein
MMEWLISQCWISVSGGTIRLVLMSVMVLLPCRQNTEMNRRLVTLPTKSTRDTMNGQRRQLITTAFVVSMI